jgi:hypothetical protein
MQSLCCHQENWLKLKESILDDTFYDEMDSKIVQKWYCKIFRKITISLAQLHLGAAVFLIVVPLFSAEKHSLPLFFQIPGTE